MSGGKIEGVFYRGKGCDECRGTGYRGRIGIFELLPHHDGIARIDSAEALERRTQGHRAKNHDDDAPGRAAKSRGGHDVAGRNPPRVVGRLARMNAFRYQASRNRRRAVDGRDRSRGPQDRAAVARRARTCFRRSSKSFAGGETPESKSASHQRGNAGGFMFGQRIRRKDITAFTREISALLGAAHSHSAGARQPGRGGGKSRAARGRAANSPRRSAKAHRFRRRWRSIRNCSANFTSA